MSYHRHTIEGKSGYIPQVLFVGKSGVGKTSLICKFSQKEIKTSGTVASIGGDYVERYIPIGTDPKANPRKIRLFDQQFDMGGSPQSILRHRDIIVLVWSLTDTESYRNLDKSLESIYNVFDCHNPNPPDIVLCANKCDEMRTDTELIKLCRDKHKQIVVKTSAKDGTGIDTLKSVFSKVLSKRLHIPTSPDVVNLTPDNFTTEVAPVERPEPNCC